MKVWMLTEAFALTEDCSRIHDSLQPWARAYKDRKACFRALKDAIAMAVEANYEGFAAPGDDESFEKVEGWIEDDIKHVHARRSHTGRGCWRYNYSTDDREVVWRVYPSEVDDGE